MECPSCNQENPTGARFCMHCAAALVPACASCGAELPAGARFCPQCADPVNAAAPGPRAAEHRDPRAYTPKHLADKILQSKSAIEGERKQVTVLFADVKGSMELSAQMDPEEWHGIMNRFLQILADGVHRFEGTVNQYLGDGIMALFGAPIAHEDHAQRACYAALHLRDALRAHADELRLERGLDLATRMGLNSGEVVVGKIGDDLRMDYTAQGHVVNVAQRMEQLAESGRVYLAKQTADRVSGYFRLREIGPTRIKGLPEPLGVYELEDVGEFQGRFDVSRERGLSRFVGRELEMAQLEAALEGGLGDRCRFVGIVAEAGTGKSRLVYEFTERCRARGLRLIIAGCPPHGKNIPFGLSMAANRSLFGLLESDDRETARNKVAGQMSRADPALASDVPFMLDFLGLAEPGASSVALDPEARLREVVRIVERLLVPLGFDVLVFEDLHWADPASETVTVQISRADLPNRRLKIYTYRPEYRPAEADWPQYEEIRLKPLSAESTAELVRDLLGQDPSVNGLAGLIQERAAGNPFFVEEIVHSLAESGQLEGARGSYRLVRSVEEVEVPDSVQAVLAARIDRLDELAKRVLQAAAVIGLEFPVAVVEEVAEIPRRDVDAALHVLAGAGLVYQLAAYPEVEYAFKHALTRAVSYDTQLGEARRRAHARVARVLEQRHEDKLEEKAGLIAYHWEEAGEVLEAARWHARAARWLESRDVDGALREWHLTRSLLSGEGDLSSEEAELATVACAQVLGLGWRQGMGEEEAKAILEEGRELAVRSGDLRSHVNLLWNFGVIYTTSGDPSKAQEFVEEAFELAAKSSDPEVRFRGYEPMADFLFFTGRPAEAVQLLDASIELGKAHLAPGTIVGGGAPVVWAFGYRGWILTEMGRLDEADESLRRCEEETRKLGMTEIQSWTESNWASNRAHVGDVGGALTHARRAIDTAEKAGSNLARVWAHDRLGVALALNGEWDVAVEEIDLSLRTARETQTWLTLEAELLAHLAEAQLGSGDPQQAQQRAVEAIDTARRRKTPIWEAHAHLTLARVLLSRAGRKARGEIESALESCLSLVEQTQARVYEPHVYELRAELAHLQGDAANRERHLREAHRLYTEMCATGHAERVAREIDS